jgi:sugar/nucleoside kinase (ribokinase family)
MDPTLVLAGRLRRDTLLPPVGRPLVDVPGGGLLYAAAGAALWTRSDGPGIGLLARVGEDYPHEWLRSLERQGFDVRGVRILPSNLDLRFFQVYLEGGTIQHTNPVAHFTRLGLPFPKSLIGYQAPAPEMDDREIAQPASPRPAETPAEYQHAHAVHVCPLDYPSQSRLIPHFRQGKVTSLTVDPAAVYMKPDSLKDVLALTHGLTAFLPSEEELRALFWGQTDDLWAMVEEIGAGGCELVVVKRGGHGQMLYDAVRRKRWEIPPYPVQLVDPTGAGDSFCGGFLAGYHATYDPLQGVLHGNISASLAIEGSGAFHALEVLPGLAQARLESLVGMVRTA